VVVKGGEEDGAEDRDAERRRELQNRFEDA
jgi:hypothetical protein